MPRWVWVAALVAATLLILWGVFGSFGGNVTHDPDRIETVPAD